MGAGEHTEVDVLQGAWRRRAAKKTFLVVFLPAPTFLSHRRGEGPRWGLGAGGEEAPYQALPRNQLRKE